MYGWARLAMAEIYTKEAEKSAKAASERLANRMQVAPMTPTGRT